VIGDPGLIISDILPYAKSNQYKLGIIPHESEILDNRLNLIKLNQENILIISPRRKNPKDVLKDIVSCEYIVSSSLHGLIVADSYNIPNGRIKLNDLNNLDNSIDYKFKDYYSSLGEELKTLNITGKEKIEELISICRMPPASKISVIKSNLDNMFRNFVKEFTS
jgi:pyruvyltransferase